MGLAWGRVTLDCLKPVVANLKEPTHDFRIPAVLPCTTCGSRGFVPRVGTKADGEEFQGCAFCVGGV